MRCATPTSSASHSKTSSPSTAGGATWRREGLTRKQRSLNNLCLAALNRHDEFELHFRGAIRNGSTRDELRETLIQIPVYAGIRAGIEAFRIARTVFAEEPAQR